MLIVLCAAYDLATGIAQLIAPHAGSVDFHIYYAASRALAQGRSPYAVPPPCCFSAAAMRGYTYPPLFAFLFIPLTHVPVDDAGRIWLLINYASLLGVLVIGVRAVRKLPSETVGWLALAMLASGAIGAAMYGIQVDPVILLLEAVFAWSVVSDRALVVGGLALAFAACLKISPVLIAPAILLLPRDRALQALGGLAAGLLAGLVAMLAISHQTLSYFMHVLPSFSGGVINQWNRSLPGVVLRVLSSQGIHPPSGLGSVFLVLEVAALAGVWLLCSRVPGIAGRALTVAETPRRRPDLPGGDLGSPSDRRDPRAHAHRTVPQSSNVAPCARGMRTGADRRQPAAHRRVAALRRPRASPWSDAHDRVHGRSIRQPDWDGCDGERGTPPREAPSGRCPGCCRVTRVCAQTSRLSRGAVTPRQQPSGQSTTVRDPAGSWAG